MGNRRNLLNLFTQDVSYNYHLIRTEEPNGHLLYLIKNGSELIIDTLEFSATMLPEELIKECEVKIEKIAPAIFFTEEFDTAELKEKLNNKFSEDALFSSFIDYIKDEYRILEIKDTLLYKKDPEAYEAEKQKEHIDHQKDLWEEYAKQLEEKKKSRENALMAYNNDLLKILKEVFESSIEYEKRDFDLAQELNKFIGNLIDPETWIKINDQPYLCRTEICSLEQDRMNVFFTDNNDYSYTATLRFDKTVLVTENVVRINDGDELPITKSDYEVLTQLFDIDCSSVEEWEYKNETDRFEYVIDLLVPIFKKNKEEKEKEWVDKVLKERNEAEDSDIEETDEDNIEETDEEDFDFMDVENNLNQNTMKKKNMQPTDWYFDVSVPEIEDEDDMGGSIIALSKDPSGYLDDQLGSHSLSKNVIDALNRAGICGDCELMEAMWEVEDPETKTKYDIIESMKNEGFKYSPGLL